MTRHRIRVTAVGEFLGTEMFERIFGLCGNTCLFGTETGARC